MNTQDSVFFPLLESLEGHFRCYLAIDPKLPLVLALWSLATYIFESFDAFPYLAITSPTKRCGKTRVAELLELVCFNSQRTVGISPAALFRSIEKNRPTLLIDEAESLRGRDERSTALREILNAGYRQGQTVMRCVGEDYTPRKFGTFCPKVLVLIGSLPDTLADRCIAARMKRRTAERLERFRFGKAKRETEPLRMAAEQWAENNRAAVEQWYQGNDLKILEDREAELWLPLFAICAVAAPRRMAELETVAREIAGGKAGDEAGDMGVKLLADIRELFDRDRYERLATSYVVSTLNGMDESPWAGWSQGRGLNARSLSHMLRPFGIHPKNLRLSETHVAKGYERGDFEDAWSRYLCSVSATPATDPSFQQDRHEYASATVAACSGSRDEEIDNVYAACGGVADKKHH